METSSTSIADTAEQDGIITARLVTLAGDNGSYAEAGMFADFARAEAQREASDAIAKGSSLAAEAIKRARDSYRWLGIIDRKSNVPVTLLPTLGVSLSDSVIPQHPWSNEPDDYSWYAEFTISNPLPGVSTVAIETRKGIFATKALQQGEILALSDSFNSMYDDDTVLDTGDSIANAVRVLLTAEDGTVYVAHVPGMNRESDLHQSVEDFVAMEKQAVQTA
jgi:hypothetical protein